MMLLFSILSIVLAMISAAYLQLPTFILVLGYQWFHHYEIKRWICRTLAIAAFLGFISFHPPVWSIVLTTIPFLFLFIFSLVNANSNVYIALCEQQIEKIKTNMYSDTTQVLGYADEAGNAIAYPLEQLVKPRHLLNDTFMGKPLFVSYCMACRSAMVYDPVVNGQRLYFEVLGVYRRNMVIADTTTGTVWQQGTGEAIYGKLKGCQLNYLPYQQMNIKEWQNIYPGSFIAYEAKNVKDGIFSKERLMKMLKITERLVAPGRTDLKGLPLREKVFGVQIGADSKAYPLNELQKIPGPFKDFVGNTEVTVDYNNKTNHIRITESSTGKQLTAQSHWWFGWKEFHPHTEIWKA